ncbi:MAG: L,D-transpeptidase, partial [Paracoccus sp. (in: a-proteobacteria)]|nr:L,D-transpeptidase [Paracoccus sp. (in: a-proteobacteria)]
MRLAPISVALALVLAACTPQTPPTAPTVSAPTAVPAIYGARVDAGPGGQPIDIRAVRSAYLNERTMRTEVTYNGPEAPGTIVVDPYARLLYHVQPGGMATRYGVAVGTAGRNFSGSGVIQRKAAWPSWTPTPNMVRTQPELYAPLAGGMAGGPDNPLGSRALYLYQNGRDTYYRIHGTLDPSSIGKATSAGCIRMFNQDVIDLYEQIRPGTRVVV